MKGEPFVNMFPAPYAGHSRCRGSADTGIIPQLCRHAQTLPVKGKHSTVTQFGQCDKILSNIKPGQES